MKFTLSWLKSHLETSASLADIVDSLTMLGLEVDGVTDKAAALAAFTIASIVDAGPHPNAERLRVCKVDTGHGILQVVCGAPNARAGIKVVFAPSGAVIPRNGMVLKPSVIRGVESNGMLCSSAELGLSDEQDGIMELSADAPVGAGFAAFAGLDDPLLDVKITANRADCLGVRGIARDLAASGIGVLKPLAVERVHGRFKIPFVLRNETGTECPLFVGRWVRGVRNGESPAWLKDRLISIGLRPISALVDITNFMTFDVNRPLHVFDAAKVQGDLTVRVAHDGESLAALNGKTYGLEAGMVVIADDSGVLSLGGVMGGESSGCSVETTDVFIEAALFDPVRTAATGRKLNLQSDSRYRFERGLDPAFVYDGMEIATKLVLDLCGGEPSDLVVAGAEPHWTRAIDLRLDRVMSLGGVEVAEAEIRRILEGLGCRVERETGSVRVFIPSWRADIEGEADLVEEVLRLHGYAHIPVTPLSRLTSLPTSALDPVQRRVSLLRRVLASQGLDEAVTYSFMASADLRVGNGSIFGETPASLFVVNPISADLDVMRPTILPNLLKAAKRNADRGFGNIALFEIGPQYADDTEQGQSLVASGIRIGETPKSWNGPGKPVSPFDVKADVMGALVAAGVPTDNLQIAADPPGWYHPGRGGTVRLGPKTILAHFGEVHPRLVSALDLKAPCVAFELYLDAIPLAKPRQRPALKLSLFQPVERDFAFIVDRTVTAEQVLRAARSVDKKLVSEIRLFDVYVGPGIPNGKKSLAITVILQPVDATLTEQQIDAFSSALVAQIAKMTGGILRG